MIHYHGTPITPRTAAIAALSRRHAMVSFANPQDIDLTAEICQSFALDNGAYPIFTSGKGDIDVVAYAEWVAQWGQHPACDWCLIPDKIDGTERENDQLIERWSSRCAAVPVWHLHESPDRLRTLAHAWTRVALGSSGEYWEVGSAKWWHRMGEAMGVACEDGFPVAKLHGLRMLNPTIFSQLPLSSADSTNVARNIGIDKRWKGPYVPKSKATRALVLIDRIEAHASASRYAGTCGTQMNWELFG